MEKLASKEFRGQKRRHRRFRENARERKQSNATKEKTKSYGIKKKDLSRAQPIAETAEEKGKGGRREIGPIRRLEPQQKRTRKMGCRDSGKKPTRIGFIL